MSADIVVEEVPKFVRRYGDYVVEGSNNTIIIMGTDRAKKGPASIKDGLGHVGAADKGKGTSTVHIIAGRSAKDPDLVADSAYLYLTRKSKVDDNLDLASVEGAQNEKPAAILKSDLIRIIGRKDIKICANNDQKHYLFMDGKKIKFSFQDGPATLEIVDKKITITMGTDTIMMDDKKAIITVDKTIFTMDGKEVEIDAPFVHLKGGCEKPWDTMFKETIATIKGHNHMSAVGPTTPETAGPASAPLNTKLDKAKTDWDSDVKGHNGK